MCKRWPVPLADAFAICGSAVEVDGIADIGIVPVELSESSVPKARQIEPDFYLGNCAGTWRHNNAQKVVGWRRGTYGHIKSNLDQGVGLHSGTVAQRKNDSIGADDVAS